MTGKLLRFGFHGFLNAQPLLTVLSRLATQAGFEIVVDTPAVVAEMLMSGRLDLAMVPSAEYLRVAGEYKLVPGLCIASRGPVSTVLLVAKTPLDQARSLALDERSRTSVALLKILYGDRFSPAIEYRPARPDLAEMLRVHDAALIIGDQALNAVPVTGNLSVHDLGEEWFRIAGRTFVHAVVAVRPGVFLESQTLERIGSAGQEGAREIATVAQAHSERTGVSREICEGYLREKIIYRLGAEELDGLEHFRDLCHERGLVPQKYPIRFL